MSSTDTPADQNSNQRPVSRAFESDTTSSAAEAVIAALDDADVALDPGDVTVDSDDDAVTMLPDSGSDAIEILDAEPLSATENHLAGTIDPVDLLKRRARNESTRDRLTAIERQLRDETEQPVSAALQHEIAALTEQTSEGETDAAHGYAAALKLDAALRPNLWALRRIYYRRGMWPSLLRLLDIEADSATSARERAELLTEKGHILEDRLSDVDGAMSCYRAAHELDREALAPLVALEKVLTKQSSQSSLAGTAGRPSDDLLAVYRALATATKDPGRRVALLIEQARIEEEWSEQAAKTGGRRDVTTALNYLHDAYDVGVDQLKVIDEIVRVTAAAGRIPDCLTALEIRAEILDMQAENAPPQRKQLLTDQIVGIRRWQAHLAKDRVGNLELAWQYLDKAQEKSPTDPLLGPDLLSVAEALGQPEKLIQLLLDRESELRIVRPEDGPPPVGVWLKQAAALWQAGRNQEAEQLEAKIAELDPSHLILQALRQRRAMQKRDLPSLAKLLIAEAEQAQQGQISPSGEKVQDLAWATESLIAAADCFVQSGDLTAAEALVVRAESLLPKPLVGASLAHRRLLDAQLEEIYIRSGREGLLAGLFERRLTEGNPSDQEETLIRESLIDLYSGVLASPEATSRHQLALSQKTTTDLRLIRRQVLFARQRGDVAQEEAALRRWIEASAGQGQPQISDELRRSELLVKLGRLDDASALYEHILTEQPGHPQAIEELERIYLAQGKKDELSKLLQRQIELVSRNSGEEKSLDAVAAERALYAKLIDVVENELKKPEQAATLLKTLLTRDPSYLPALSALTAYYRRENDSSKLQVTLGQVAEQAPTSLIRGEALLSLAELRESLAARPTDVDELYEQAIQALPLPSAQATRAALGRLRAVMQQRKYDKLPDVMEALADSLPTEDPLTAETVALLMEERAAQLIVAATPTSSAMERADAQLVKARKDLRQLPSVKSESQVQLLTTRVLLNQRREDGKAQGTALADLAEQLLTHDDPGAKVVAAELLVRSGLLGALFDDEPGQHIETTRRLLLAYRTLGDQPLVVVALADLLSDPTVLEQMAQLPDVVKVLRARQSLCPESERGDRVAFILLEAEAFLAQSAADEVDDVAAAKLRQSAAEAALRALALDPQSVAALMLLRQATEPSDSELDPLRDQPLTPDGAARLRAYALYTLRLASLLSDGDARTDLYSEAGQLLTRIGDQDGAAASLRTALDGRPLDDSIFQPLLSLLQRRAEQTGDNGPLLELLDFRLAQVARTDDERRQDLPIRVALLSQRAALHLLTGQNLIAASDLETLLSLQPDHTLSHRRLAALRAQHGDLAAAAMHYRKLLELATDAQEQLTIHRSLGELLLDSTPEHAMVHIAESLRIGATLRTEGGQSETSDEVEQRVQQQKRLLGLQLRKGDRETALETLRRIVDELPTSKDLSSLRQSVLLEVASLYERDLGDRGAALSILDKLLSEQPLQLTALDRLVQLASQSGETARAQGALSRARDEARKQAAALADVDSPLSVTPFATLAQVFEWQKQSVSYSLAGQASGLVTRALGGSAELPAPPPARQPERSVGPPLRSTAFSTDARGILLDMWQEIWETGTKLLGPDVAQLSNSPKDRLNAKKIPPSWITVDNLAQRFGLGNTDLTIAYSLVAGKEKDLCVSVGSTLVCGSAFTESLSSWSQNNWFRLIRRLALLPDRLGAIECAPTELVLFFAACCQLVSVPTPALSGPEKTKLDDKVRALDRAIARKERSALRNLASRMQELSGENGKNLILGWQRAILRGSATLALAITGNLSTALAEAGVKLDTDDEHEAKTARALLCWSVSAELIDLRRELGLIEKE